MKKIALLALACLPHTAHTAHQQQWGGMEHKPLPGQPQIYPHGELERMAQEGMPRERSVSDIAQQFGGSKGTLRRPNKPAHLPPAQTQQHPQPSAPLPPAYHPEWLPLSPQSPQSAPSDRSPSACSTGSHSSELERTSSYRAGEPNYVHHFLHEPVPGWTSHSSTAHPSTAALTSGIKYIQGEDKLPDEVQRAIKELRTQHLAFAALVEATRTRSEQLIIARVALQSQDSPRLTKRPLESKEHLQKRERDSLNTARTKATDQIGKLTQDMRVVCKEFSTK